jgi:Flp pilus assembly pilin Flp
MRRQRRNRGTATVEYAILLMVIVLPFVVAMVALSNHLVPFFDCIEYLNGLSLP